MLAGIAKATGHEVVPRKLDTDHFIEAELTPYRDYVQDFATHFIKPPQKREAPQEAIAVDDAFIGKAREAMREYYDYDTHPVFKLQRYIGDMTEQPNLDIESFEVTADKHIKNLKLHPALEPEEQKHLDKALEFIGHDEVVEVLQLAPAKYVSPLHPEAGPQHDAGGSPAEARQSPRAAALARRFARPSPGCASLSATACR